MHTHDTPLLAKKMQKAAEILDKHYDYFNKLVSEYKIKLGSRAWDIACFLVDYKIQNKSKKRREEWWEFWYDTAEWKKMHYQGFIYVVPDYYSPFLSSKGIEKIFLDLLGKITQFPDLQKKELFIPLFKNLLRNSFPYLNPRESDIFSAMIQHQSKKPQDVIDGIDMHVSNVSKYIRKVMKKGVLFQGVKINLTKLNLQYLSVYITHKQKKKEEIYSQVAFSPYFRSMYRGKMNIETSIINYIIPNDEKVIEYIEELVKKLSEKVDILESKIMISDHTNSLSSYNYSRYNGKARTWNLTAHDLFTNYLLKPKEKSKNRILRKFTNFDNIKLKIDRDGIKILNHMLGHNIKSMAKIQKKLENRLTEYEMRKYIDYLQENQVYTQIVVPVNIFGLISIMVNLQEEKENQEAIHRRLSILPEVHSIPVTASTIDGINFVIRVPEKELVGLVDALYTLWGEKIISIIPLSDLYSPRWLLPEEKYDTLFKRWKFERKDFVKE